MLLLIDNHSILFLLMSVYALVLSVDCAALGGNNQNIQDQPTAALSQNKTGFNDDDFGNCKQLTTEYLCPLEYTMVNTTDIDGGCTLMCAPPNCGGFAGDECGKTANLQQMKCLYPIGFDAGYCLPESKYQLETIRQKQHDSQNNDNCVICPQVMPTCEPTCKKCLIVLQKCDKCAMAVCRDGFNDTAFNVKVFDNVTVFQNLITPPNITLDISPPKLNFTDRPDFQVESPDLGLECVMCTKMIPICHCDEATEDCIITKQTCRDCSKAVCHPKNADIDAAGNNSTLLQSIASFWPFKIIKHLLPSQ